LFFFKGKYNIVGGDIFRTIVNEKTNRWNEREEKSIAINTKQLHVTTLLFSQPWRFQGWEVAAVYHWFIITIIFVSLLPSRTSIFILSQSVSLSLLVMLKLRTFSPLVDSKVSSFNSLFSLSIHNKLRIFNYIKSSITL